ncbi:DUF2946 domain-containing protein [Caballeronia mineralivorans]|jgi:hypothetical protein|uniref:DUF2946 domain-containing protein n=1 Tax=Caballeronia mineralivorans TaxID=2010198 RepID=UPI000EFCEF0A|nr:DUF2946 domain-containing protein [Caballeronia mineralivorans]MDB5786107.1 hypothetical protein [Caballeronia mineralivorans]MEA3101986.1 hypothetical protein [Caballeronia mineralivorans]
MNRTSRNRFVAWLGIAAMWLAIVAPVISQTIASRQQSLDPQAAICSVDALAQIALDSTAHAEAQTQTDEHTGHHMAGADSFDACSYCGLLAHNVPLASAPAAGLVRIERVTRLAAAPVAQAVHVKLFNAASPRAPPVVS